MIIILKENPGQNQLDNLISWIRSQGVTPHITNGLHQTILCLMRFLLGRCFSSSFSASSLFIIFSFFFRYRIKCGFSGGDYHVPSRSSPLFQSLVRFALFAHDLSIFPFRSVESVPELPADVADEVEHILFVFRVENFFYLAFFSVSVHLFKAFIAVVVPVSVRNERDEILFSALRAGYFRQSLCFFVLFHGSSNQKTANDTTFSEIGKGKLSCLQ